MAFAANLNQEAKELAASGWTSCSSTSRLQRVFDEVRDWGVAALERARRRHPKVAVTSAMATASRPPHDEEAWATSGASTRTPSRCSPILARQVSRCELHVPIELIAMLQGKDVLVGCTTSLRHGGIAGGRGEGDPRGDEARAAERIYPCTNCGMVPCRARSPAASSPRVGWRGAGPQEWALGSKRGKLPERRPAWS